MNWRFRDVAEISGTITSASSQTDPDLIDVLLTSTKHAKTMSLALSELREFQDIFQLLQREDFTVSDAQTFSLIHRKNPASLVQAKEP